MEWTIVEKSADVLEIFYEVTKEISVDKYLTLSTAIIFIGVMTQSMIQYEGDASLPLEVSKLVDSLKEEIMTRLRTYEENELVTQSALLDPRFKKLAFSNTSERRLTNAMSLLRAKVCTISLPNTIVSTDITVAQVSHFQSVIVVEVF